MKHGFPQMINEKSVFIGVLSVAISSKNTICKQFPLISIDFFTAV